MHNQEHCDEWSHDHRTEDLKVQEILTKGRREGYILGALSVIFISIVFDLITPYL